MKIMIEASVYNRHENIVIAIDGDGSILNIQVSKKDYKGNIYYGDGLTIDTNTIGEEA